MFLYTPCHVYQVVQEILKFREFHEILTQQNKYVIVLKFHVNIQILNFKQMLKRISANSLIIVILCISILSNVMIFFFFILTLPFDRVATDSGKQGKQGKWWKIIPCMEKSGNLKKNKKIREKSGNFKSHVKKLTCWCQMVWNCTIFALLSPKFSWGRTPRPPFQSWPGATTRLGMIQAMK